jgi:flagellar motility protein MotE (MotC chaperone)
MSRANQALIVLTAAVVGIWGCAQSQGPGPSAADRLRALEVKNAKLEDDFRAVAAARDQLRRKLAAAEEQQQQLQKQLEEQTQALAKEREQMKQQLTARTTERDALLTQFEQFRKGLKDLLGQAEAAVPHPTDPVTSAGDAGEAALPEKS